MSFSLCQPILINQTLTYLTNRQHGLQSSDGLGWSFVLAYGVVYITRAALIAAIHNRTLELVTVEGNEHAALTLVG